MFCRLSNQWFEAGKRRHIGRRIFSFHAILQFNILDEPHFVDTFLIHSLRLLTLTCSGNGHTYETAQPFVSEGWYNYWRVQVDQGFNAPPLKVTVRGTTPDSQRLSMNVNGGKVFPGGFIKLDRRGGLYEGAVATDADGKPLISGSAGR